jgi:hypothetical protein
MITLDPNRLYKFGKTNSKDVLERYDPKVHYERKWANIPFGRDYDIKTLWSMWVLKERADRAEKWFENTYVRDFYSITKYNGIRESRMWSVPKSYEFMSFLDKNYPKTEEYWNNVRMLEEEGTLQRDYDKIYYIMLTKKTITWQKQNQ